MSSDGTVHARAVDLVRLAIEMTTAAGSGHPSSAASLAHLVSVLMFEHMRHDPRNPDHPTADRLVLSEGHACPIVYAAASLLGIEIVMQDGERRPMTRGDAMQLRAVDSPIDGHPNPAEGFPFFPAATGSLGQGLSVAAGIALAADLDRLDKRVFCLIGDGEAREGQVWEAVDFLAERSLRQVLPIFNCNGLGQTGTVSRQQGPEALAAKLRAFGFDAVVIDGHDPQAIREVLTDHTNRCEQRRGPPLAVVARTVKGWGVPSLQGEGHHGKPIDADELAGALVELDETARRLGARAGAGGTQPRPRPAAAAELSAERRPEPPATLSAALRALDVQDALDDGKLATRDAFGVALRVLGEARPDIVVVDGDVADSTRADRFGRAAELADRFFWCGISEQHMVSCAAGLASAGKTPFVASFGKFITRGYDQLELALLSGLDLKIVGSHVGVTPSPDGPSQMGLVDAAFFGALATVSDRRGGPLVHVLTPADAHAAYALTLAAAEHSGACYIRTMRPSLPLVYDESRSFSLGGHHVLAEGRDILLAAWGYAVHSALAAREQLARRGVQASVVDLYSLPFDGPAVVGLAEGCAGRVLTIEDNYGRSLGSAVADALAAQGSRATLEQLFVRRFPKSARSPDEAMQRLGLGVDDIVTAATELVQAG